MKTLKKLMCAILLPLSALAVSCTDSDTWEPGPQEIENNYDVYFPDGQENTGDMEVDPTDGLTFTYKVARRNADGNVVVPVEIKQSTEGAFAVSPIEFADGDDETTFTVELSGDSEIGVKYSLEVNIVDPAYSFQYTPGNALSLALSITRVKWLNVGWCDYTEDLLTTWWGFNFSGEYAGVTHPTYKVQVQVREDSVNDIDKFNAALAGTGSDEDLAGTYRMKNAYQVGPWGDYDDPSLETNPVYILIYVPEYNKAYIPLQEVGLTINGGMASIYSEAGLYIDNGREPSEDAYGIIRNGKLTFGVEKILGCPGSTYVGTNTYYANGDGAFCLNIAPALNQYELVMPDPYYGTDGDFSFADVKLPAGTAFYSESLYAAWEQNLQVGTPTVSTDDADKLFAETYGKLYRLPDCYASGYDIYFCVNKSGNIVIPSEFESQMIGIRQLGQDLSIVINATKSSFNTNTNEVSLAVEMVSSDGELSFGNFSEVLSATIPDFEVAANLDLAKDFNYTTMFKDSFKSGIVGGSWKAELQSGRATDAAKGAAFEAAYGKAYCLPNLYVPNYNIYFCGKEDGSVSVPADYTVQPTGLEMFGHKIYATVVSGTVNDFGATLRIQFADENGDLILGTYNETIVTYTWVEVATGVYDTEIYEALIPGRVMEQAEGTDLYRINDFFGTDMHFEFTWNSTTNKCQVNGLIETGIDVGGTPLYVMDAAGLYNDWGGNDYSWELFEKNNMPQPTYDPKTLTFSFYLFYGAPSLSFGMGLGWSNDRFVLDAAPAVVTWEDVAVGTFTHTAPFFIKSEYLPYSETDLVLQRFGTTNKYKIVDLAEGSMDMVFTHNAETGDIKVVESYTGLDYREADGSLTPVYCGDVWAGYSAWISAGVVDSSRLTSESETYQKYPNSYDAATKTYTFSLMYYDHFGYTYTGDDEAWAQTFQITGDAPAAATASVKSVATKKVVANVNGARKLGNGVAKAGVRKTHDNNLRKFSMITEKQVLHRKSSGKGLAGVNPTKRDKQRHITEAAL